MEKEQSYDLEKLREKEGIELLEIFFEKYPVSDRNDKAGLILAYLGKRPAVFVSFSFKVSKNIEDNFLEKVDEKVKNIKESLNKLNLKADINIKKAENDYLTDSVVFCDAYISRDQEKVVRLKNAFKNEDNKEIGLALGYPETAVESFVNERLKRKMEMEEAFAEFSNKTHRNSDVNWNTKNLPLDTAAFISNNSSESRDLLEIERKEYQELMRFAPFKPSKNNWRDELETVKDWRDTIKEKSFNLYEEIKKQFS